MRLKRSQVKLIEEIVAFPNGFGYVLDFSDRTISEFFEDEFSIDFDDEKYSANGTSKRNRLTTLIALEDPYVVAKVLRALWERREGLLVRRGCRQGFTPTRARVADNHAERIFAYVTEGALWKRRPIGRACIWAHFQGVIDITVVNKLLFLVHDAVATE